MLLELYDASIQVGLRYGEHVQDESHGQCPWEIQLLWLKYRYVYPIGIYIYTGYIYIYIWGRYTFTLVKYV